MRRLGADRGFNANRGGVIRGALRGGLNRCSPGRELRLDLFEESCASLRAGVIHVVVGEIVAAGRAQIRRIERVKKRRGGSPVMKGRQAPAAIGAHDAKTLDVVKAWRPLRRAAACRRSDLVLVPGLEHWVPRHP
jgi:hypothetical protein